MELDASKKRKIYHDHEDEDEEQKIEKFFALIENIREARDRLVLNGSNAFISGTEKKKNQIIKVKAADHKQVAVWKPSFQREDFMERAPLFNCPPHVTFLGSAQRKEEAQKEITEEGLDLTLSL
ncbi:hypothetical protein I3760_07G120800 [Carya illinoinensis]|uniref:Uncharacterized protein n=1 Tax=Carya illinoinensis TaxID=32201 RepID=A0A8T1PY30_CARIL|nr:NRR repressor homolog 3-like [Carya illinoinensis]KAG2697767.1 hypothetical protein I3760_07G120800 [Carya illinoinensis]KAG6648065.1 hypothetical protein CIPAW_07G122200 [Carya illinoinensis]KAG6704221.1 hypothetical protein I3842_07G125200 [Carya illinoinensis]